MDDWDEQQKLDRAISNLSYEREGADMWSDLLTYIVIGAVVLVAGGAGLHWLLGWVDSQMGTSLEPAVFGWLHSVLGSLGGLI